MTDVGPAGEEYDGMGEFHDSFMMGIIDGSPGTPTLDIPGRLPEPVPPDVRDRVRRWVRTCLGLRANEPVSVTQVACRGAGGLPVETLVALIRHGAALRRTIPLPADLVSVADVQLAFADGGRREPR